MNLATIQNNSSYLESKEITKIARSLKVKIFRTSQDRNCVRCGGDGIYKRMANPGTCYRCGGCGVDPKPEVLRNINDEDFEKLNNACLEVNAVKKVKAEAEAEENKKQQEEKNNNQIEKLENKYADLKNKFDSKFKAIEEIAEALKTSNNNFANDLAKSLYNGEAVYGSGISWAAELAAKQVLGKKRMSKAVEDKKQEFKNVIIKYQEETEVLLSDMKQAKYFLIDIKQRMKKG